MSSVRPQSPNVIVIGAGPVGLTFAIDFLDEAKHQHKDVNLMMIEAHEKYQRTQRLNLDAKLIMNESVKKDLAALIEQGQAKYLDKKTQVIEIPIQTLENCLLATAKKMQINIHYKKFLTIEQYEAEYKKLDASSRNDFEKKLGQQVIVGMNELLKWYPDCKLILGADGSKSAVRQLVSEDEKAPIVKTELREMIELNYLAKGKMNKLSPFYYYETHTLLGGVICTESINYVKETDQTKVTLRFLVDPDTYNDPRLDGVNAKNLLALSANIPAALKNAINIWVNMREDEIVPFTPVLNKTDLSMYKSAKLWGKPNNVLALLIGDAARGFPFMNGLNLGIENSNALVKKLVNCFEAIQTRDERRMQILLDEYIRLGQEAFAKGAARVNHANTKISVGQSISQSSYVSSFPVKAPIRAVYKKNHPILFANDMLDLTPLRKYVARTNFKTSLSKTSLLGQELLLKLEKGDLSVTQIKSLLYQAYQNNRAMEEAKRKKIKLLRIFFRVV